jgi:hypothetical protein
MRHSILAGVLVLACCDVAGAQEAVLVLAEPIRKMQAIRLVLQLPDSISVAGTFISPKRELEIPRDNLLLIIFDHNTGKVKGDPRPMATVVYAQPGSKTLTTVRGLVGYLEADKVTPRALPFSIPAENGAWEVLAPQNVHAVQFMPHPSKVSGGAANGLMRFPPAPCVAFTQSPQIITVPARSDSTAMGMQDDSAPRAGSIDYRFKTAAHFPVPQFGSLPGGEFIPSSALIIYEGMQIRLYENGKYDVCFTATTPDIPVTLRLQFQVCAKGHKDKGLAAFTITLPPIAVDGDMTTVGNFRGRSFHVRHSGYSPELYCHWGAFCPAEKTGDQPCCDVRDLDVVRQGVARFGSLPLTN